MKAAGVGKYPQLHALIPLGFQQFRAMQLKEFSEDKQRAYVESRKFMDEDKNTRIQRLVSCSEASVPTLIDQMYIERH